MHSFNVVISEGRKEGDGKLKEDYCIVTVGTHSYKLFWGIICKTGIAKTQIYIWSQFCKSHLYFSYSTLLYLLDILLT